METKPETEEQKEGLPPVGTVLTGLAVVGLFYVLFSGELLRFYASAVFLFYSYIKSMWLSVVCLGVFQTILMMPFRMINLALSVNIKEFEERIESESDTGQQQFLIKESVARGEPIMLWYIVNFIAQTLSYLTIGRLFLIDFYNVKLNPGLLYDFVPYPSYPIQDRFFKLPYVVITKTLRLSWGWVLLAWLVGLVYKMLLSRIIPSYRKLVKQERLPAETKGVIGFLKRAVRESGGYLTVYMLLSWLIIRHFPLAWEMRIFSGDVGVANYTLNAVTAIGAGFIIFWLNIPKILHKGDLAREAGVADEIILKTQKQMFKETIRSAILLGLGAYYITRMIPSAFELSIFTLEMITLFAPLTLDRLIFSTSKVRARDLDKLDKKNS
jgi:hypothetical protein